MLLRRFNVNIEQMPGKKNKLLYSLSRQLDGDVSRENQTEDDAFLSLKRIKRDGKNLVAALNVVDLRQQVIECNFF
jgi:hypothetical protein